MERYLQPTAHGVFTLLKPQSHSIKLLVFEQILHGPDSHPVDVQWLSEKCGLSKRDVAGALFKLHSERCIQVITQPVQTQPVARGWNALRSLVDQLSSGMDGAPIAVADGQGLCIARSHVATELAQSMASGLHKAQNATTHCLQLQIGGERYGFYSSRSFSSLDPSWTLLARCLLVVGGHRFGERSSLNGEKIESLH